MPLPNLLNLLRRGRGTYQVKSRGSQYTPPVRRRPRHGAKARFKCTRCLMVGTKKTIAPTRYVDDPKRAGRAGDGTCRNTGRCVARARAKRLTSQPPAASQ